MNLLQRNVLLLLGLVADIASSNLVWSDEFNSPSVMPNSANWGYDLGDGTMYGLNPGWGNGELQVYTQDSSNVRVINGELKIIAREIMDGSGQRSFTSARLTSEGKFAFQYGTLMAKIKVPDVVEGLWSAFWTMGNGFQLTDWPASGELDIMEIGWKGRDNRKVYSAAHWEHDNGYALHDGDIDYPTNLNGTYAIYKMEWNSTFITTYVNDVKIWDMDLDQTKCVDCEEFRRPHSIRLNVAVGGGFTTNDDCGGSSAAGSSGGCSFRTPDEVTAPLPAEMYVDWIRLYSNDETIIPDLTPPTPAPVEQTPPPVDLQLTPAPTTRPTPAPVEQTPPPVDLQLTPAPTPAPSAGFIVVPPPSTPPPVPQDRTDSPVVSTPPPVPQDTTQPPVATDRTQPPITPDRPSSGSGKSGKGGKGGKSGSSSSSSSSSDGAEATAGGSTKSSKSSGKSGKKSSSAEKTTASGKSGKKGSSSAEASTYEDEQNIFDGSEPEYSSFTNEARSAAWTLRSLGPIALLLLAGCMLL